MMACNIVQTSHLQILANIIKYNLRRESSVFWSDSLQQRWVYSDKFTFSLPFMGLIDVLSHICIPTSVGYHEV